MKSENGYKLLLFSLLIILWGCGKGTQYQEVRGKVSKIDPETSSIVLNVTKGIFKSVESLTFKVSEGDLAWLKVDREIRGVEVKEDEGVQLKQIFPASVEEESKMYVHNQALRRDTVERGEQAFREVGETLPSFALFDQEGFIWNEKSLTGKVSVITFIFTRCRAPEMCPATTMRMGKLLTSIQELGLKNAQLLSVTMDPEFDTPGILNTYSEGFGVNVPQYRFLTGSLQVTHDLKKQLGILTRPDATMLIQHTMSTVLVGPDLKILYRVPGSKWDAEDFLEKIRLNLSETSISKTQPPTP